MHTTITKPVDTKLCNHHKFTALILCDQVNNFIDYFVEQGDVFAKVVKYTATTRTFEYEVLCTEKEYLYITLAYS